ncbi:S-layer homology domain-containing protein [Psychrobacillus sp. INOP01]|uniref:S-layer homology domain-containing protein n=1 Tax=Psychrobacillus sp. INOP01 TaxID=2829187 RepID=UPI001BA9C257|nr:S-layer homology domain-containing protein [Psychrobacillus sp. INOP01]QUG40770.1 S-layer homology domain-containing protein [Psychrobacillus sp. INOP01]
MKIKGFKIILMLLVLMIMMPLQGLAAQTVNKDMKLSSGVQYKQYTNTGARVNSINHLAINLNDAYTKVNIGLPKDFSSKDTTTNIATGDSVEGNRVVGAVNAAFFDMSEGYPLFLISQQNEILNGGVLLDSTTEYFNQPIAFGVTADGNAEIDLYDFDIKLNYDNLTYDLSGLNRERRADEAIIFTPQNIKTTTDSNQYGIEVVFESDTAINSTYYGQTITGKVKSTHMGSTAKVAIPKNGFVLSFHGPEWRAIGDKMKIGEEVSVEFDIDSKWKDSQFMLASGPMLVKDGKKHVTMNLSSARATQVTSRSAIAISKDKKTVHLVTVDGANKKGMNMSQFADYLVSLGVDRALNLDGGGSTTMGIRNYGSNAVVLANNPSAGSQRRVSAILEAISTAPTSKPSSINLTRSNIGTMLVGATSSYKINYILDEFYNPITVSSSKIVNASDNNLVSFNGTSFTALKEGSDRVRVNYETAFQSFPLTIVSAPTNLTINASAKSANINSKLTFTANATDADNKSLIYSPEQLKWSVEGGIGTITSAGVFTAGNQAGTGKVVAQLGTKKVSVGIEVKSNVSSKFTDILSTNPYITEINYLTSKGYINGYEDGTFKPNNNITRANAAVLISRVKGLNLDKITDPNFKDVPKTHPYYKEIAAIANLNIVNGKENGYFDPNGKLTRAQMAKILVNAYNLSGTTDKKFTDVPSTHWAVNDINTLTASGVTTGFKDGTYKPENPITRMHFSVFLYRIIQ